LMKTTKPQNTVLHRHIDTQMPCTFHCFSLARL
jgi:hypothetical protein